MADDLQLAEATAPLSFAEFLDKMKDPAAADLVRSIKNFIRAFEETKPDPDRDCNLVQQFLAKSEGAFRQHPVWAAGPPAHQAQAIEGLEKYLMTKIYAKTFAGSELDRERDQALHVRMKALGFVQPSHLDLPESSLEPDALNRAKAQLSKINSYKAPRDKLVCILNCSRIINGILTMSAVQGKARGADDFLPILIYIVIHSNPPQLASNLEYIQRFRMKSRMVSESSYFFTQLYSAATFIETINASSLTMDPNEFKARMISAGVPDMQHFTDSGTQLDDSQETPFQNQAKTQPTPLLQDVSGIGRQEKVPQHELGSRNQTGSADSVSLSLDKESSREMQAHLGGHPLRSLSELEEAGYGHLLKAEESGALQERHPFIYASAPDLRVSDVSILLAAYKRIVLRYESLSLLLAHEHEAMSTAIQQAMDETGTENLNPPLSLRPPAVIGPNPFAGGGFLSRASESYKSDSRSSHEDPRPAILTNEANKPKGPSERIPEYLRAAELNIAPSRQDQSGITNVSLETLLHRQGVRPSESDIFPHRISSLAKNPKLDPVELIQGEKERENEPQGADSLPHGLSIMPSELQTPEPVQELQINPDHGNKIGSKKSEVILPRASVTSPFEDEDDETHQEAQGQNRSELGLSSDDLQEPSPQPSMPVGQLGFPSTKDEKGKEGQENRNLEASLAPSHDSVEFSYRSALSPFEGNQPNRSKSSRQESLEPGSSGGGFEHSPFVASADSEAFSSPFKDHANSQNSKSLI